MKPVAAKLVALRIMDDLSYRFLEVKSSKYWTLPGGRLEANESSAAGLARELDEELPNWKECFSRPMFYDQMITADWVNDVYICCVKNHHVSVSAEIKRYRWTDALHMKCPYWKPYLSGLSIEMLGRLYSDCELRSDLCDRNRSPR